MGASPVIHPSVDALRAFALGKLNEVSAEVVMNHLDGCADCCKEVAAMTSDDFLARLRQAHEHKATPAKPQVAIPNLPPELANNPQYEVLRELGRGGMGVVYLAHNKLMDRTEVLKVVNKSLLDRPGAVERFLREIRSAAKLSHPNVVAAYSAVQFGELLAFAMEYVEGEDLAQLVKKQGPLPVMHACYYVQQAALGLQHAYEKKMVHRDIKPHNLILSRDGKKPIIKILDFGLAKATREKGEELGLTGTGAMLSTPDYVAPEQSLDAATADIRADIYSLGCTLYYLLAGAPPFSGKSLSAVLLAHQSMEAKPLNLVRPEVPEELAAVVQKMMAKDPAKRYQTPAEVVQALGLFGKQGAKGTLPKSSLELSMGASEAQSAGAKTAKPARPLEPATGVAKRAATMSAGPPPLPWETLTESSDTSTEPRTSGASRQRRHSAVKSSQRKKWLIGVGIGMGVLLLALLGLWVGGVLTGKMPDGKESPVEKSAQLPNLITNSIGMKFVRIPHGRFFMGSPKNEENRDPLGEAAQFGWDPERLHEVEITQDYYLGIFEVTQGEYQRVMKNNPSHFNEAILGQDPSRFPVDSVTWNEANDFCKKLSELPEEKRAGRIYRLPTEAEWEYACRAGSQTPFCFDKPSTTMDHTQANFNQNFERTRAVGSYKPNPFGVYDMHGNVNEWCQDWFDEYPAGLQRDPTESSTRKDTLFY